MICGSAVGLPVLGTDEIFAGGDWGASVTSGFLNAKRIGHGSDDTFGQDDKHDRRDHCRGCCHADRRRAASALNPPHAAADRHKNSEDRA